MQHYILLKPIDALWPLAEYMEAHGGGGEPLSWQDLLSRLCAREGGKRQVDASEGAEFLKALKDELSANPEGVLGVLTKDL